MFWAKGKGGVLVRHLLTHTSGLPDQLAENQQLREKHAPLEEFIRRICDVELLFPPGANVSYQSLRSLNNSGFGDLASEATYGHSGATGTLVWIDPKFRLTCVIFTNEPEGASRLRPLVSNAVDGSVVTAK